MRPQFLPIKITSEKYAQGLLEHGEIFMRALHEFGTWGVLDVGLSNEVRNNYRGDLYSGVTEVFASPNDSEVFSAFPSNLKDHMKMCCYIDNGDPQYFKIYSMICWDYDEHTGFLPIDPRMAQFGDSAVIITDFNQFLSRLGNALMDNFESISIMCERMKWFDFCRTGRLNPIFYKYSGQSYQNEIRIAACPLHDGGTTRALKKDFNPITIRIGNLRDIAMLVPVDQIIHGDVQIPMERIKWPGGSDSRVPSVFDRIVDFTNAQMNMYHCTDFKPMFSI